jgi:hypothetical protein
MKAAMALAVVACCSILCTLKSMRGLELVEARATAVGLGASSPQSPSSQRATEMMLADKIQALVQQRKMIMSLGQEGDNKSPQEMEKKARFTSLASNDGRKAVKHAHRLGMKRMAGRAMHRMHSSVHPVMHRKVHPVMHSKLHNGKFPRVHTNRLGGSAMQHRRTTFAGRKKLAEKLHVLKQQRLRLLSQERDAEREKLALQDAEGYFHSTPINHGGNAVKHVPALGKKNIFPHGLLSLDDKRARKKMIRTSLDGLDDLAEHSEMGSEEGDEDENDEDDVDDGKLKIEVEGDYNTIALAGQDANAYVGPHDPDASHLSTCGCCGNVGCGCCGAPPALPPVPSTPPLPPSRPFGCSCCGRSFCSCGCDEPQGHWVFAKKEGPPSGKWLYHPHLGKPTGKKFFFFDVFGVL